MTSAATKSKLLEKEKDKDVENTATDGAREAVRARLKSLERALNFDKPFIGLRGEEGETEGHNDESDAEEHDVQRRLSVGWGSDGLDQSVREEALEGDALQLVSRFFSTAGWVRSASVRSRVRRASCDGSWVQLADITHTFACFTLFLLIRFFASKPFLRSLFGETEF